MFKLHKPPACLAAAALALSGLVALAPAHAAPVRYFFQGTVSDDADATGYQVFAGYLRFESTAADLLPAVQDSGVYAMPTDAGFGLAVSFDLQAATFATHSSTVSVLNNYAGADWFLPLGYTDATQTTSISLELFDPGATAFSNDALPLGLPALAGFASARLKFDSPDFALIGRIDEWVCDYGCATSGPPPLPAPIPEPGSLALALGGLALIASRRPHLTTRRSAS